MRSIDSWSGNGRLAIYACWRPTRSTVPICRLRRSACQRFEEFSGVAATAPQLLNERTGSSGRQTLGLGAARPCRFE
jgi:hypothetical protein